MDYFCNKELSLKTTTFEFLNADIGDMGEKLTTKEAVENLDFQSAFKLIEFYQNAANTVKNRTWTITTWILTVNAALIAFCFQLYANNSKIHGFLSIQASICVVGIVLCIFLRVLINDQGKHLRRYWTNENKVGAWNTKVQSLILEKKTVEIVLQENYRADFPRFCKRLRFLSSMFLVGFIGTFVLMWILTKHS